MVRSRKEVSVKICRLSRTDVHIQADVGVSATDVEVNSICHSILVQPTDRRVIIVL